MGWESNDKNNGQVWGTGGTPTPSSPRLAAAVIGNAAARDSAPASAQASTQERRISVGGSADASYDRDFLKGDSLSYKDFLDEPRVCCEGKIIYLFMLREQKLGKLEQVNSKRLVAKMNFGIGKIGLTIRELEKVGWLNMRKRGPLGTIYVVRRPGWEILE